MVGTPLQLDFAALPAAESRLFAALR